MVEQHRKAVDGESLLSGEVDQAPLPEEEDQSQCFLLPFPCLRGRRGCGWVSPLRELPMSRATRRWKILTFTADLFYVRHPLSGAAKDALILKNPVEFTCYLGGDSRIQHWQAHIQNHCYPAEEPFEFSSSYLVSRHQDLSRLCPGNR